MVRIALHFCPFVHDERNVMFCLRADFTIGLHIPWRSGISLECTRYY